MQYTTRDEAWVIALYQNLSLSGVSQATGIPKSSARTILQRRGVTLRASGYDAINEARRVNQAKRDRHAFKILYHLYWERDMSISEVAKAIGWSSDRVLKTMMRVGLARRATGGSRAGRSHEYKAYPECSRDGCVTHVTKARPGEPVECGIHRIQRHRRKQTAFKRFLTQVD